MDEVDLGLLWILHAIGGSELVLFAMAASMLVTDVGYELTSVTNIDVGDNFLPVW